MKRQSLIFIILLSCVAADASNFLTSAQKGSILAKFSTEVKYNFAYYDKVKNYWDSLCNARFETIINTPDDYSFKREMERLCAELNDGHTFIDINIPNIPREEYIRPLPFTTRRLDDMVYVTEVRSSKFADEGVETGTQLLEIDGMPVNKYYEEEVAPFIPSSTKQWREYESTSDYNLTKKPGNDTTEITFRNPDGRIFKVKSTRLTDWDIPMKERRNITYSILPQNIGLLKIKSFNTGIFNTDELRNAIDSLSGTEAMIIDVRDNSGGNSANSDLLMQIISGDSIQGYMWTSPQYIAAYASWNIPTPPYTQISDKIPGMGIYTKPVAVIQNNGSFSSTENFINHFKGAGRGVTIGEITGGSTGNPILIDLGYGATAGICTRKEFLINGGEFVGVGIKPDIEVKQSKDILYGKDNILETAWDYLIGITKQK